MSVLCQSVLISYLQNFWTVSTVCYRWSALQVVRRIKFRFAPVLSNHHFTWR